MQKNAQQWNSNTPPTACTALCCFGAAEALTGALLNGANIGQVAKATFTGAALGAVGGLFNFGSADPDFLTSLFRHSFSQGFLEGIQGGNMFHGFMMGAVAASGGYMISEHANSLGKAGMIASNAILSGTVAEIGGGKFANGAITGAFAIMFNDMMHPKNKTEYRIKRKKEIEKDGNLTFAESVEWWSIGNGETIEVDVNSLNLDFIDISNRKVGSVWYESLEPGGKHQWGVYGTVTVGYLGNNEIVLFPDVYDFDIKPNPTNNPTVSRRNLWTKIDKAIHGKGVPYKIVFKGKYKLKKN